MFCNGKARILQVILTAKVPKGTVYNAKSD